MIGVIHVRQREESTLYYGSWLGGSWEMTVPLENAGEQAHYI